jgi:hypothetical protein
MVTTMTKPIELECTEDLELLLDGDPVNISIEEYDGVAIYKGIEIHPVTNEKFLTFEVESEHSYMTRCIKKDMAHVQDNKIVQREYL